MRDIMLQTWERLQRNRQAYTDHYNLREQLQAEVGKRSRLQDLPPELATRVRDWRSRDRDLLAERKQVEATLDLLAEQVQPRRGERELVLRAVSPSMYATQGFGAGSYARADAERAAGEAIALGIDAEVVTWCRYLPELAPPRSTRAGDCVALVRVEHEIDVEIIRRRPVDLVEWVADCWRRGVNPRVYYPWLPFGFEAQHKITYQGEIAA